MRMCLGGTCPFAVRSIGLPHTSRVSDIVGTDGLPFVPTR